MKTAKRYIWIYGSLLLAMMVPVTVTAQDPGWLELSGEWPTYGFDADQTRGKLKDTATRIPKNPAKLWELTLPAERFSGFFGGGVIGPLQLDQTHTLYMPFFGRGGNTGGVEAITSEGEPKWYFRSTEVEMQTPLLAKTQDGKQLVIFGNAGARATFPGFVSYVRPAFLIAIFDSPDPDDPDGNPATDDARTTSVISIGL
jgi:hypothetical protein